MAHFLDEDKEGSNANDGDVFAKYSSKVSSWTPPEVKFSVLDHYTSISAIGRLAEVISRREQLIQTFLLLKNKHCKAVL